MEVCASAFWSRAALCSLSSLIQIALRDIVQDLWTLPNCMIEKDGTKLAAALSASTASHLKYDAGETSVTKPSPWLLIGCVLGVPV